MTTVSSRPEPSPVTAREIAELTAWAARLTASRPRTGDQVNLAGHRAETAAYLAAKADLLARIADQHTSQDDPCRSGVARRVADDARAVARQATTPPPGPLQHTDEDAR